MSDVADGFGVQLDGLRRSAADLRADAGELDAARRAASTAAQFAGSYAHDGPVGSATTELAVQFDKAMGAVSRSLEECAAALDATATGYAGAEQRATSTLEDVLRPPLPPPR